MASESSKSSPPVVADVMSASCSSLCRAEAEVPRLPQPRPLLLLLLPRLGVSVGLLVLRPPKSIMLQLEDALDCD